ncbi:MAG: hypothetical protein JWO20_3060 [Candidatus Angelobacter sp.]|jgi:hypothetical protein|nr:hypothetical protein [Candidatus Angelobacter sp.]
MDKIKPLLLLFASLFVCNFHVAAQTVLDPSLPAGSQPIVKRRLLHFFPDFESVQPGRRVAPLSTRQKFRVFAGETFDPSFVVIAAAVAGIEQAGDLAPNYGQGAGPYAQRFGAATASLAVASFYSEALLPTLFHQDPRYFRKGSGSIGSRLWYAITRTVVTHQDSGRSNFNYSHIGGLAALTATHNLYYPPVNRTAADNAERFGIVVGIAALLNVAREFTHTPPKPLP